MRLALVLFRKRMPPGNIWLGKNRMIPKITPEVLNLTKKAIALEEQNMFYLRHPYLTPEQCHGHVKALGKRDNYFNNMVSETQKRSLKDHRRMEEHLAHLLCNDAWE